MQAREQENLWALPKREESTVSLPNIKNQAKLSDFGGERSPKIIGAVLRVSLLKSQFSERIELNFY